MSGARSPTSWPFVVRGKQVLVTVSPRVAVNSLRVLRDLAEAGEGLARVPELLTEEARAEGRLRALLVAHSGPAMPWHAVYPSARHPSPKLRVFLEVLEARLASEGGFKL
jgi:DNA-binding transcriptional LysR family regulator